MLNNYYSYTIILLNSTHDLPRRHPTIEQDYEPLILLDISHIPFHGVYFGFHVLQVIHELL